MFERLRTSGRSDRQLGPPTLPDGERVYAVGDIHGRLDLFKAALRAISADDAKRVPAQTTVILLGDLVDRGPHSAQVLSMALALQDGHRLRILKGNHEDMFLRSFSDLSVFRTFLARGGYETLKSYPDFDLDRFKASDILGAQSLMAETVPPEHFAFMSRFENFIVKGDYLFVHAGIRPGVEISKQAEADLYWIREPFLSYRRDHGHIIVHGHTISDRPDIKANRIGIDTGAYASGRLTLLGLEGTERWILQV